MQVCVFVKNLAVCNELYLTFRKKLLNQEKIKFEIIFSWCNSFNILQMITPKFNVFFNQWNS